SQDGYPEFNVERLPPCHENRVNRGPHTCQYQTVSDVGRNGAAVAENGSDQDQEIQEGNSRHCYEEYCHPGVAGLGKEYFVSEILVPNRAHGSVSQRSPRKRKVTAKDGSPEADSCPRDHHHLQAAVSIASRIASPPIVDFAWRSEVPGDDCNCVCRYHHNRRTESIGNESPQPLAECCIWR